MSNSEVLRLVRSTVADRDIGTGLTNFRVYDGRVQGTNGKMCLDAPWPDFPSQEPLSIPANPLVKAFEAMASPDLTIKEDTLTVKEGKMRVRIPLSREPFTPQTGPTKRCAVDSDLLLQLRTLRPFVSDDASRPWSMGVKVTGGYMYATNNVIIVRKKVETDLDFDIPGFAIDQLGRSQKEILGINTTEKLIDFILEDDVWFSTVRYAAQWPEIDHFFDRDFSSLPELNGNEKAAVEKVLPFVPDPRHPVIRFTGNKVATLEGEMEAEIETEGNREANLHATPLLLVLSHATHFDFNEYPKFMPFRCGNGMEGVMIGVRL